MLLQNYCYSIAFFAQCFINYPIFVNFILSLFLILAYIFLYSLNLCFLWLLLFSQKYFFSTMHDSTSTQVKITYTHTSTKGNNNINVATVEYLFLGTCISCLGGRDISIPLMYLWGEEESKEGNSLRVNSPYLSCSELSQLLLLMHMRNYTHVYNRLKGGVERFYASIKSL